MDNMSTPDRIRVCILKASIVTIMVHNACAVAWVLFCGDYVSEIGPSWPIFFYVFDFPGIWVIDFLFAMYLENASLFLKWTCVVSGMLIGTIQWLIVVLASIWLWFRISVARLDRFES